ncbi:MAG: aldehyde dehydrogenase family protein [Armatimonadetes bacterium]|nr:aldehyde dehydrogenase family protein [Armatimonadota bacterium]
MSRHEEMLINGTFVGGPCDQAVGKEIARSPLDGHVVGTYAEGGWSELRTSILSAADAFPLYRQTSVAERQRLLREIAARVRDRRTELSELMADEIGKPVTLGLAELDRCAFTFELAAAALNDWNDEVRSTDYDPRGKGRQIFVRRRPVGVVFGIVPYNWPFNLTAHKVAPALAVGCTMVIKPSPQAALSTMALGRIIHESGCPHGAVNVWAGSPRSAEKGLMMPEVNMLSFTGSPAVGWALKEKMGRRPVVLELGGDAFALVGPDADLDDAVAKLVPGAFAYAGQICISVQHILVHESVYAAFRDKFLAAAKQVRTGEPRVAAVICGPMISEEAAKKLEDKVEVAEMLGATILLRGERQRALVPPIVLENVPESCDLGCEEAFGPVCDLAPFTTWDEAFARVNRSKYGIQAGLFSHDPSVIERAWDELEVGGIVVNDSPSLRFDASPYGGVKESGWGREGIREAMLSMTEPVAKIE